MDRISAFMDGETSRTEAHQAFLRLKQNDECCETWKTFHLIGDALRGDPELRDDFAARFHARMEQEPTMLAPRMIWRKSWNHAMPVAASLAAVTLFLAMILTDNPLNPLKPQAQIAATPIPDAAQIAQTAERPRPTPAANQGKVNEYLMAHQEFSPSTALQGVAPYVRTVSETHDGGGR